MFILLVNFLFILIYIFIIPILFQVYLNILSTESIKDILLNKNRKVKFKYSKRNEESSAHTLNSVD